MNAWAEACLAAAVTDQCEILVVGTKVGLSWKRCFDTRWSMEWSPWSGSRCCRLLTNTSNGYATGFACGVSRTIFLGLACGSRC